MTIEAIRELEQQEINKVLNHFESNLLTNDEDKQLIKDALFKVFKCEISIIDDKIKFDESDPLSSSKNDVLFCLRETDIDMGGIPDRVSLGKYKTANFTPSIELNLDYIFENLHSEKPEYRKYICQRLFIALFHELRHYEQDLLMNKCISSKETLLNAKDNILGLYFPNFYSDNYYSLAVENDATAAATRTYQEIMGDDFYFKALGCIHQCEAETGIYKATFQGHIEDEENKEFEITGTRELVSSFLIDSIIKNKNIPDIFEHYPILLKQYNLDFTKIPIPELMSNMKSELEFLSGLDFLKNEEKEYMISEAKLMYCQMLLDSFSTTPPNEMSNVVEQIGQDDFSKLLDLMRLTCTLERINKTEKIQALNEIKSSYGTAFDELFNNENSSYRNPEECQKEIDEEYDSLDLLLTNLQNYYCKDNNESHEER